MSRSLNKVQLIGRLGKDPEIRYMPSGVAVMNVSMATSEQWKDKESGEKKERTEWHNLVAFKNLAEICGEYLKKGDQAYFEGRLVTRKWQDKEGNNRYTTEVHVSNMMMLGGKGGGGDPGNAKAQSQAAVHEEGGQFTPEFDDDIPF